MYNIWQYTATYSFLDFCVLFSFCLICLKSLFYLFTFVKCSFGRASAWKYFIISFDLGAFKKMSPLRCKLFLPSHPPRRAVWVVFHYSAIARHTVAPTVASFVMLRRVSETEVRGCCTKMTGHISSIKAISNSFTCFHWKDWLHSFWGFYVQFRCNITASTFYPLTGWDGVTRTLRWARREFNLGVRWLCEGTDQTLSQRWADTE